MLKYFDQRSLTSGLLLHAVAVLAPGGAILLLGHSGAGKTTLSSLLAEQFPKLIDDNVYIMQNRIDKKWYITDAKLLHTGSCHFVPLLATIRTFQSRRPQLIQITPREICRYLLDAIFEIGAMGKATVEQQREWFVSIAEVARNYPGWRLSATLSPETPKMVWDCFQ